MANFTPQEIEEMLQEFFAVTGKRQYVGARYVPQFGRRGETSIDWDNTAPYEPLTIVIYQGNSYTSRTYVPTGVNITDENYWALTGAYNAQVEAYRQEVIQLQDDWADWKTDTEGDLDAWKDATVEDFEEAIDDIPNIIPASAFDSTNTVKKYIDDRTIEQTEAYFFGDSWGVSATSEQDPTTGNGYVQRLAQLCQLNINNYHVRGCGFVTAGVSNETMLEILQRVTVTQEQAKRTKYVFVCCGTNDGTQSQADVAPAISTYFAALKNKFPYSIIIYTPNYVKMQGGSLPSTRMEILVACLNASGERLHVNDSTAWLPYAGWWADDGIHLVYNGQYHWAEMIYMQLFANKQQTWPITINLVENCPLTMNNYSAVYSNGIVHIRASLTANRGFQAAQQFFRMGLSLDPLLFPDVEINSPLYSNANKMVGMIRLGSDGLCYICPSEGIQENTIVTFNLTYATNCYKY